MCKFYFKPFYIKMQKNKEISPKSLTSKWLRRLDIGGCNPKNPSKNRRFISYFYIFYNAIMVILMTLDVFFVSFNSIGHFAEGLIITLGFFQEIVKIITCLVKAKVLNNMINIIWYKFWTLDDIDTKTKNKVLRIYKILKMVAKGYEYNIIGATVFYIIGAVSRGHKVLPMDIWIPNKQILKQSPYYEIVFLSEVIFTLTSALFTLIPFDALFITMIGLVYCQFIIINSKLIQVGNTMDEEQDYKTVKHCIAHHNLLLNVLQMIELVYSNALLLSIGSNLFLSTLTMYGIVMESDMSRIITFGGIFLGVFFQLYFYCQTGQFIQDKVESIGETAYKCNWTNISSTEIKMSLKLIIIRSQRRFNITMGGFMVLNLETFAQVVRTSFSFLTFLENVKS